MIDNKDYFYLNITYNKLINFYKKKNNPILIKINTYNENIFLFDKISKWLLCDFRKKLNYCNNCINCKLLNLKSHIDFINININYINNDYIGVDYIKLLINSIYNKPIYSKIKLICIYNIELLNEESINCLLKIIEEHPKFIFFIFSCYNFENVKLTLKSRCTTWSIDNPNFKLSFNVLKKKFNLLNTQEIKSSLKINDNNLIKSILFLSKENLHKRYVFFDILKKCFSEKNFINLYFIFMYNFNEIYNPIIWFIIIIIDSIKYKNNIFLSIKNLDKLDLIKVISLNSNKVLFKILLELINYNFYINKNININKYIFTMKIILFIENIIK